MTNEPDIAHLTCEDYQQLYTSLIDGELSASIHSVVENHLAACHNCRSITSGFRQIKDAINETLQFRQDVDDIVYNVLSLAKAHSQERADNITQEMLMEIRNVSLELKELRSELTELKQKLSVKPSSALDLPYMPKSAENRYRLV